jgi:serine/threonine-protein kinase
LRDGSGLVFHVIKTSDDIGIWRKSSGAEEVLLATPIAELEPSLSPDERFMAYVSDESGRREVYIRALGGAPSRVPVSSEGGDEPVWSPQGRELFYRRGAQMIALVSAAGRHFSHPVLSRPLRCDPFHGTPPTMSTRDSGGLSWFVLADAARSLQLNIVVN